VFCFMCSVYLTTDLEGVRSHGVCRNLGSKHQKTLTIDQPSSVHLKRTF
jgi:hypothetical protein